MFPDLSKEAFVTQYLQAAIINLLQASAYGQNAPAPQQSGEYLTKATENPQVFQKEGQAAIDPGKAGILIAEEAKSVVKRDAGRHHVVERVKRDAELVEELKKTLPEEGVKEVEPPKNLETLPLDVIKHYVYKEVNSNNVVELPPQATSTAFTLSPSTSQLPDIATTAVITPTTEAASPVDKATPPNLEKETSSIISNPQPLKVEEIVAPQVAEVSRSAEEPSKSSKQILLPTSFQEIVEEPFPKNVVLQKRMASQIISPRQGEIAEEATDGEAAPEEVVAQEDNQMQFEKMQAYPPVPLPPASSKRRAAYEIPITCPHCGKQRKVLLLWPRRHSPVRESADIHPHYRPHHTYNRGTRDDLLCSCRRTPGYPAESYLQNPLLYQQPPRPCREDYPGSTVLVRPPIIQPVIPRVVPDPVSVIADTAPVSTRPNILQLIASQRPALPPVIEAGDGILPPDMRVPHGLIQETGQAVAKLGAIDGVYRQLSEPTTIIQSSAVPPSVIQETSQTVAKLGAMDGVYRQMVSPYMQPAAVEAPPQYVREIPRSVYAMIKTGGVVGYPNSYEINERSILRSGRPISYYQNYGGLLAR